MMNPYIEQLKKNIEPLREQIIQHKVYGVLKDIEDIKVFMKYHVYAVWDFMSLLKSLQQNLTCTTTPWFPVGNAETRFLINEIVCGEESDLDMHGVRKSHFEMYLDAMKQIGCDTTEITTFITNLQSNQTLENSFINSSTPSEAKEFVNFTFDIINSKQAALQAAIFTFGREDLIPGMFMSLVGDIHKNFPNEVAGFKYYLERHIEVDGDHHSHLALEMTASLCGSDEKIWKEVEKITLKSLEKRIQLWDGVYNELLFKKSIH